MNLITFNIRCADDKDENTIEERAPRLKTILERYDADLIGFQEVTPKWFEILKNDYSDKYEIFNKFRSKTNCIESSPIMWKKDKFTLIDKGYFWFSDTPWVESLGNDALWHCERICEWVLLEKNATKKQFYHFNLHFGFGDDYQVESVNLIKTTVDALKAENVVITGDFNMKPDTLGYKQMTEYFTDVNKITANYNGTTYHNYGTVENEHIDYCFVNDGISARNYHIINDTVDSKYPSDHYGILFEIKVK